MPGPTPRNDPCPCGSGKKYKKCHGAREPVVGRADVARANALKSLDLHLDDRLMRFARVRHGPGWLSDVLETPGLFVVGEPSDAELPFVLPWAKYCRRSSVADTTLVEEWRRDRGDRLSADERVLLDAYQSTWVSLWEVTEVERGVGSKLKDRLTGEERFVYDARSSVTLQRFETLLAIILTCDGVSFFGGVHGQPLPPREADAVLQEAKRICRVRTRPVNPERLRDPALQLDLHALWGLAVRRMMDQPPPRLSNTDGDPFALTRDEFTLREPRDAVVQRLGALEGIERDDNEMAVPTFVVTKPGNSLHRSWQNTVIGSITVSDRRLTIETNSTRRADEVRRRVEAHLGGMVAFRLRIEEDSSQMIAAAWQNRGQKQPPERSDPELAAVARELRQRAMVEWLDDHIPALGGLTPREAARSPRARPKLELLLKELEHHENQLDEEDRTDLASLREELGFSRNA